jgi:23S rRNA (pseudouridine1915-N3)-methyltransferase
MKIIFAMHGKPKDKRILELIEEYQLKISRYQKIDFEFLSPLFKGVEGIFKKYSGKKVYLLDEDGKEFTSQKFAENYEKDLNTGEKEVVFVIGPAEGYGELPNNLNTISLSKMAMQHDIAGLVLIEQIYRAVSIKNNLPYHRV